MVMDVECLWKLGGLEGVSSIKGSHLLILGAASS